MLMEDKTKDELVKQRHQIDKMRTDMEANMRTLRAESETSYERLRASMAGYSAKTADQIRDVIKFVTAMAAGIVVVLGVLIKW